MRVLLCLIGFAWAPVYLIGDAPSPLFTGCLVGFIGLAAWLGLILRQQKETSYFSHHSKAITCICAIVGVLVYSGINIYKWSHFHFIGQDIATIQQALWNKLHHGSFQISFNSLPSLDGRWHNHFGVHAHYLLLVLLGPFSMWPHTLTLLLCKVLALGACAIPLYLFGKAHLGERGGLFLVAMWFCHPIQIGQMTFEFYELQFAPLILLCVLYAFQQERYTLYLLGVALLVLLREDLALTAMMLAPYALLYRRSAPWAVGPVVIAGAAMVLNFGVLQPLFRGGEGFPFAPHFGDFGQSPKEVIIYLLTQPTQSLATIFQPRGIRYLFFLLQPGLLILPFLAPEFVLLLPSVTVSLLATRHPLAQQTHAHYSAIAGVILLVATVHALAKIERWSRKHQWLPRKPLLLLAPVVLVCTCLSGAYQSAGHLSALLKPHPYPNAIRTVLAQVPPKASVLTPRRWAPYLANRQSLFIDKCPTPPSFIIMDTHTQDPWQKQLYRQPRGCLLRLRQGYHLVQNQRGIKVYARVKHLTNHSQR